MTDASSAEHIVAIVCTIVGAVVVVLSAIGALMLFLVNLGRSIGIISRTVERIETKQATEAEKTRAIELAIEGIKGERRAEDRLPHVRPLPAE